MAKKKSLEEIGKNDNKNLNKTNIAKANEEDKLKMITESSVEVTSEDDIDSPDS